MSTTGGKAKKVVTILCVPASTTRAICGNLSAEPPVDAGARDYNNFMSNYEIFFGLCGSFFFPASHVGAQWFYKNDIIGAKWYSCLCYSEVPETIASGERPHITTYEVLGP